jgi:hypothetical protein
MTRYEKGFLTKCAEYGIDGRELLYKQVVKLPKLPKYIKDRLYKIKGMPTLPEYNPLKGIKGMPKLPEYNIKNLQLKGIKGIKGMPKLPEYNIKNLQLDI